MTPEREREIDEEASYLHGRRRAFTFYVNAFFDDLVRGLGYEEGDVLLAGPADELAFTAHLADGRRHTKRADRSAWEYLLDRTEDRLYPGAGSMQNLAVEKAHLLRPQWHIEKTAARELANRMTPPLAGEL